MKPKQFIEDLIDGNDTKDLSLHDFGPRGKASMSEEFKVYNQVVNYIDNELFTRGVDKHDFLYYRYVGLII